VFNWLYLVLVTRCITKMHHKGRKKKDTFRPLKGASEILQHNDTFTYLIPTHV
jgi:hypothetical protein